MQSFPKIQHMGTKDVAHILEGDVEVTEKIDGSQFIFGKDNEGTPFYRSKGNQLGGDIRKLFQPVVKWAESIMHKLGSGITIYGETIHKKGHGLITYDRVPTNHFVLFGAEFADGVFLDSWVVLSSYALYLGCDVVPLLLDGKGVTKEDLGKLIGVESYLGGHSIEGFVVKNYDYEGSGELASAKYVSDDFKEKRGGKKARKLKEVGELFDQFNTVARYEKAVQHLRDNGDLEESPKDIGPLLKHLNEDLEIEWKEEVKEMLYKHFRKEMLRRSTNGFPQWYKNKLAGVI